MMILAIKINLVNAIDYNQFVSIMQFDIKKPKIYSRTIQNPYITQWAKTIEKRLN